MQTYLTRKEVMLRVKQARENHQNTDPNNPSWATLRETALDTSWGWPNHFETIKLPNTRRDR